MSEPTALERALLEAAAVLQSVGAPYALIGGFAVAVHTRYARATTDVDFAVRSDLDRDGLAGTLVSAGFAFRGRFEHSLNFLHASGAPVQLAFDPGFDEVIDRAEHFPLAGKEVRIARREDLIALKERSAADPRRRKSKALQDRADVERLRGDVPDQDEGW
ncbi:MAG: hypothetical protein ACT4PU_06745 [Planctomycetota bacterium]